MRGVDEGDGWIRFEPGRLDRRLDPQSSQDVPAHPFGTVYLPKEVNGMAVMVEETHNMWRASNEVLRTKSPGIGVSLSKNLSDKIPKKEGSEGYRILPWGAVMGGVD